MVVVPLEGVVIDQPGHDPTDAQLRVPLVPDPAMVKVVVAPPAQSVCGGPATAVGFSLTTRLTHTGSDLQPFASCAVTQYSPAFAAVAPAITGFWSVEV